MLGTFFRVIERIFRDNYTKYKPFLVYFFMIFLIVIFYLINKRTFNEMYINFINQFNNKNTNEKIISENMTARVITNKKPQKRVQFNNINKQKIFDYKEPPQVVSETNEIEGMDNSNSWLVESKKKMIIEDSFVPDMMFPQNSNELIKQKNNIETVERPLKDIFSDMSGDVESDVTDEQRRLIQGRDYNEYSTDVMAPENLFTQYDQPHFNKNQSSGIKPFTGNTFGSLI